MAKTKKKNQSDKKLAAAMKSKAQSQHMNPFEIHLNRQKHKILGQRMKNDKGIPGVSRAKAMKKRKETLLREFNVRNKANAFIDRRIGEKDSLLSTDHKMLARFASEKKKQHKKDIFNLNEDEELTHQGQSLSTIERFDDPRSDSEDEDKLGANFVDDAHFGGFLTKKAADGNEGYAAKSRAEVINEMIAKSKQKKHEQKAEREATLDLTDKLDSQWKEMNQLITSFKRKPEDEDEKKVDDFDVTVRELKYEIRGKAKDKMKTAEEVALEKIKKLEELEGQRLLRMKGLSVDDEETPKHKSADDIDDGFLLDDDTDFQVRYDDEGKLVGASPQDSSDDENDEKSIEVNDEQSDEENEVEDEQTDESEDHYSDLESDDAEEETLKMSTLTHLMKRKKIMEDARKEVPYTFKVPEDIESLKDILEAYDNITDQVLVIERMMACNHPSLSESNKAKLETLFVSLIIYLLDKVKCEEASSESLKLLNKMTPLLHDLNQFSPDNNGFALLVIIQEKREEFTNLLKKKGSFNVPFPEIDVLLLLQLLPVLFSSSDFCHLVITPALVFISQIFTNCKIRNLRDIFIGLYLCEICQMYVKLSKRFIPEVMNFLKVVLMLAVIGPIDELPNCKLWNVLSTSQHLLRLERKSEINKSEPPMTITEMYNNRDEESVKMKVALLKNALIILNNYCKLYEKYLSFMEVIQPHAKACCSIQVHHPSAAVIDLCSEILDISQKDVTLESLQWQKRKALSIKMLEPKIEEDFNGRKKMKGSKKHVEKQKLLHKYRQEMKGAMREIRKDNQFLARELLDDQLKRDEERKRKVKKLLSELANQEGDYQAIKRKKNSS